MHLYDLWFAAIAALVAGYLLLEGFEFGVGVLLRALARDDAERRVLTAIVAPVWDGNEVWLIAAGGAMYAAFPAWCASLSSALRPLLLAVVLALVARGVALACRDVRPGPSWRRGWDVVAFFGSLVPAFLLGVASANVVRGLALDDRHLHTGTPRDLLNVYALIGGAATLLLFIFHGAAFTTLRTSGELRERARRLARQVGGGALAATSVFLLWTQAAYGSAASAVTGALAVLALAGSLALGRAATARDGRAFALSAAAVVLGTVTLFAALYPDVLPSTTDPAHGLTAANASAAPHALRTATAVAAFVLPLLLIHQSRTYRIFRRRVGTRRVPA